MGLARVPTVNDGGDLIRETVMGDSVRLAVGLTARWWAVVALLGSLLAVPAVVAEPIGATPSLGSGFTAVAPCRVVDTRSTPA